MKLSDRMMAVAQMAGSCKKAADIGTDHGYVPIWLVKNGCAESAIATDVRPGPLSAAEKHIREEGLSGRIELRLCDGLKGLKPHEADSVIIAGMGGYLTVRILSEGAGVLESVSKLILEPQSGEDAVRYFLTEHGFMIECENMVFEDGKYYVIMRAVHGNEPLLDEEEAVFGRCLIRDKNPVLYNYLVRQEKVLTDIIARLGTQDGERCRNTLEGKVHELNMVRHVMTLFETSPDNTDMN